MCAVRALAKLTASTSVTRSCKNKWSMADANAKPFYSVGDVHNAQAPVVKIVHISDTHWMHGELVVPDGDILVHSGDFVKSSPARLLERQTDEQFEDDLRQIKAYFASLPHPYKIFVAGNHELSFTCRDRQLIRTRLSPECIYLHNSHVTILGITFYGSPYTKYRYGSTADAFVVPGDKLKDTWVTMPRDTDVVVTHGPPNLVLDIGIESVAVPGTGDPCDTCGARHPGMLHYGCEGLRAMIFDTVRPKAHLFGHNHDAPGVESRDNIVFSNAAMPHRPQANVFHYHVPPSLHQQQHTPVVDCDLHL